jgi:transposase
MGFREVSVVEIREILRRWMIGQGLRSIATQVLVDRKTVRRYVEAAVAAGLRRDGDEGQLTDALVGAVCEAVRPARPSGRGAAWDVLAAHHDDVKALVDKGLKLTTVHTRLERKGVVAPYRTLHRYAVATLEFGRRAATVRVDDPEPGIECQVDFGRMGLVPDPASGRRRVCHALIFTACYSRHCFVWLTFNQTTEAVIAGFEAAWNFFQGVFKVVIPDNLSPVVAKADAVEPRFTAAFAEYAQSRGFLIDTARVGQPRDKPKVERAVPFVRDSMFSGEDFKDLADAQRRAEAWCRTRAGLRIHGTTGLRPAEVFEAEERPLLLATPAQPYDLPIYATPKVHRDRHIEVARAIYSVPGELIGRRVEVRADAHLVKVFHRGQLIKVHPRQAPGRRSTDPADLPAGKSIYATRDVRSLLAQAAVHGPAVGAMAQRLLDTDLPWTRMRQVYRLIGLCRRHGDVAVDDACAQAMEVDAVNVNLVARMLSGGVAATAGNGAKNPAPATRFVRDATEFGTPRRRHRPEQPEQLGLDDNNGARP